MDAVDANLYALTHRGNPGDVEHYVRLCQGASSVLELGAGYGRIITALAEPERALCGLELDHAALGLCRRAVAALPAAKRRGVSLVQGDMRSFALGRRFERVILPYNGVFCLLSVRDAERCFRSVRAALVPGGWFGFDVWNADRLHSDGLFPDADEQLAELTHAGRRWAVFERCQRARAPQRLDVTYSYVPSGRAEPRSQVLRQRYYRSAELITLLGKCGFAIESKLGSFTGGRFNERATRLIMVARALG